jgi:hypothetical protein
MEKRTKSLGIANRILLQRKWNESRLLRPTREIVDGRETIVFHQGDKEFTVQDGKLKEVVKI